MTSRRLAAVAAVVLIAASLFVMACTAAQSFPRGLIATLNTEMCADTCTQRTPKHIFRVFWGVRWG